jgi:hypothetical protein
MANKTRKRLTKTQLKKDPVAENLMKGWAFFNQHIKAIVIGFIAIVLVIFIVNSAVSSSEAGRRQSLAMHLLADTYLSQALSATTSGQSELAQQALTGIQNARQLATQNYRANPGSVWGRRSGILAAKCSILLGADGEAIEVLNEMLAAGISRHIRAETLIHLATAQENRGGSGDLEGAETNAREILEIVADSSAMAAEATELLGRVSIARGDLEAAEDYIAAAAGMRGDTTEFQRYQLRSIQLTRNGLIQ